MSLSHKREKRGARVINGMMRMTLYNDEKKKAITTCNCCN